MKFNDLGITEIKKLDSRAPEGAKQHQSAMTLEATVENVQQELRLVKPYSQSQATIPATLPPEAQMVLHALFDCFEKQGIVKEGVVKDLIFGFTAVGMPVQLIINGLKHLEKAEYIKVQSPDNQYVELDATRVEDCWVRYQPKLLGMVYES